MTRQRVRLRDGKTCEIIFCTRCVGVHIYMDRPAVVFDWTPVDGLEVVASGGPFSALAVDQIDYLLRAELAKEAMKIWEKGGTTFTNKLRKKTNEEVDSLIQNAIRKARDQ